MVSPIWREILVYSDTQHTHLGMLYRRHNSKIHTFMCFHARSAYPYLQENNTGKHITKAHPHIYQHIEFIFDISFLFDKKKNVFGNMTWFVFCVCVCEHACMWIKGKTQSLALFNHTNAAHIHFPKCFKRTHQEGEQRAFLKNRHELFTQSDKRTKERMRERHRERNGDGVWVIQRKRQTDGLTRTVGFYAVLPVMTRRP